jgi:hypothetical protein
LSGWPEKPKTQNPKLYSPLAESLFLAKFRFPLMLCRRLTCWLPGIRPTLRQPWFVCVCERYDRNAGANREVPARF